MRPSKNISQVPESYGWLSGFGWGEDNFSYPPMDYDTRVRTSSPFIIQVASSGGAVDNVTIGDSYANRTVSGFGQVATIAVTSTVIGVSYIEFLSQTETKPFTVGRIMIISTNAGQLDYPITVTHRDASGRRRDHVVAPVVDPYQNQTDRLIDDTPFLFDGYTRLTIPTVNSGATITVRFYPKNQFSGARVVVGKNAIKN